MARTYIIETFGCQMNVHDTERLAGLLEQAGYKSTDDPSEADLIVLNTCAVRERAEDKLFSRLGELRTLVRGGDRRPILAVAGCVAQQEGARLLRRAPFVDVVVGPRAEGHLAELAERALASGRSVVDVSPSLDVSFPPGLARRGHPVRASVTLSEGCNDFCSFCVVPYTRGPERMRSSVEILAEVNDAISNGYKEIQLLGQIVNHYKAPDDPSCDFAELLQRVHGIAGVERIRFSSPHPRHVGRRLITAIRDLPRLCKHLHLPVQSGSSRILASMRRRYTREEYLALVAGIREEVPEIALSTDVIVGFPGETECDFEDTLALVRDVRFHSMFSFEYSPRPNTWAERHLQDDVPCQLKAGRLRRLQDLQREIQTEIHRRAVGRVEEVLVDSRSRKRSTEVAGRTTGNTVVNLPGLPVWIGEIRPVRILRAGPNSLWGEAVTPLS